MKTVSLIFLLFFSFHLFAEEAERAPSADAAPAPAAAAEAAPNPAPALEATAYPRRRIKLRLGQVTQNPDYAIENSWEHQAGSSYQGSAGFFWNFPRRWERTRFFLGGEFKHLQSKSELSGAAKASIDSEVNQLLGVFGIELRPHWFSPFGMTFALDWEVWGEKKSRLRSPGFTQDLGTTSGTSRNVISRAFGIPTIIEFGVFWNINQKWKPALTVDSRDKGNALTLGVDYVF